MSERILEIQFYNFLNEFVKGVPFRKHVYVFLEDLAALSGANSLWLRSAAEKCILNDIVIRPTTLEYATLLIANGTNVQQACKLARISRSTYYRNHNSYQYSNDHKLSNDEYEAITTVTQELHRLVDCMKGI